MARKVLPPSGNDFDFPATSGAGTGWVAVLLCGAGVLGLAITSHDRLGLRLGLALALFGLISYVFLIRPRIWVRDGSLVLVNPVETVHIPLQRISRVVVRSATYVYVDKKRYVGVAVGRKVRHMTGGRGVASAGVTPLGLSMGRSIPVSEPTHQHEQRVPDLLEEWVASRIQLSLVDGAPPDAKVVRTPTWWLLGGAAVLAVAFVISLLA